MLAKRVVGGLLLIVWLAASALGQDDEDKPAKPAAKS